MASTKRKPPSCTGPFANWSGKFVRHAIAGTLLVARLASVASARNIHQVMNRTNDGSVLAQFQRLEQRIEREEALEEAYARLDDCDPKAQELADQFAEREQRERLEKEFEELKRRVGPTE